MCDPLYWVACQTINKKGKICGKNYTLVSATNKEEAIKSLSSRNGIKPLYALEAKFDKRI